MIGQLGRQRVLFSNNVVSFEGCIWTLVDPGEKLSVEELFPDKDRSSGLDVLLTFGDPCDLNVGGMLGDVI